MPEQPPFPTGTEDLEEPQNVSRIVSEAGQTTAAKSFGCNFNARMDLKFCSSIAISSHCS